jgi:hypothetical protein
MKPEEWIEKANAILKAEGLTPGQRDFVIDVRNRMAWFAARPRAGRPRFSPGQITWFASIYQGVVKGGKEKANVGE